MDPVIKHWRELAERNDAQVAAACRAVGAAGYFLGPYCHSTDAERLAFLRDVIAELNLALGLSDPDAAAKDQQEKGRES